MIIRNLDILRCVCSCGTRRGMAHELFPVPPDTAWRVRSLPTHPIVPRSLCPGQAFSSTPGRPNAVFKGENLPLHYREISNSRASRDLIGRADQIGRLSIEIGSIPKGYRACGGYGTAEVLLMGLVWLGAEAAAVLLVLPWIGLIDCRRSAATVEIDQSSLAG